MPPGARNPLCSHPCIPATNWGLREKGLCDFCATTAICRAFHGPCKGARLEALPRSVVYMALFDVRLGWWMGNPRYQKNWPSLGPPLGLEYLLSEVLGQSDQQKGYVYLSDGGHFENLAVYELIKRRCRLIVACDADCDPQYEFENLLSLIEKARTDFGVRIDINYEAIQPGIGQRESGVNHVAGKSTMTPTTLRTSEP